MVGAVLIAITVVVVLPVMFMWMGAAIAAAFGASLKGEAEARHEGSELIDTNY